MHRVQEDLVSIRKASVCLNVPKQTLLHFSAFKGRGVGQMTKVRTKQCSTFAVVSMFKDIQVVLK